MLQTYQCAFGFLVMYFTSHILINETNFLFDEFDKKKKSTDALFNKNSHPDIQDIGNFNWDAYMYV